MNARAKAQDQRERSRHALMRECDRLRAERDAWKYLHEEADDECDRLRRERDDLNEAREHPWRWAWKQWRNRG